MFPARIGTMTVAICLLAMAVASDLSLAQAQGGAGQRNRVIIQVSDGDPDKWNLALNNAKNLQTDLGSPNVDVEIVAYGPGIGMLKLDSAVVGGARARIEAHARRHARWHRLRQRGRGRVDVTPAAGLGVSAPLAHEGLGAGFGTLVRHEQSRARRRLSPTQRFDSTCLLEGGANT